MAHRFHLSDPRAHVPPEVLTLLTELRDRARTVLTLTSPGSVAYARAYQEAARINHTLKSAEKALAAYLDAVAGGQPLGKDMPQLPPGNGRQAKK